MASPAHAACAASEKSTLLSTSFTVDPASRGTTRAPSTRTDLVTISSVPSAFTITATMPGAACATGTATVTGLPLFTVTTGALSASLVTGSALMGSSTVPASAFAAGMATSASTLPSGLVTALASRPSGVLTLSVTVPSGLVSTTCTVPSLCSVVSVTVPSLAVSVLVVEPSGLVSTVGGGVGVLPPPPPPPPLYAETATSIGAEALRNSVSA